MFIIWKFPKNISGRTERPRGPHVAGGPRVWDPDIDSTIVIISPTQFYIC